MNTRRLIRLGIGVFTALCLTTLPTWAANDEIDTIVVTTQKRAEDVQDVPVPVSVFDENFLEIAAPQNLMDAAGLAPNLYLSPQMGGQNLGVMYSRAQGYTGFEKSQAPPVGVTIDGVVLGTATGQLLDLFDVQQIEFNRGPQGILFGKNTSGGAIVVKRTRPTEDFGLRTQFSYGSYEEASAKFVLNTGRFLNDMLAIKFAGQWRDGEGYYKNLYDGKSHGDVKSILLNTTIAFDPTEDFSLYFVFDWIDDNSDPLSIQTNNTSVRNADGTPLYAESNVLRDFDMIADNDMVAEYYAFRSSAELNWDLHDIGQLTYIISYQTDNEYHYSDFDQSCVADIRNLGCPYNPNSAVAPPMVGPLSPLPVSLHTVRRQAYRQHSQELRLATDITEWFRTIVGAYYFKSSVRNTAPFETGLDFGGGPPYFFLLDFQDAKVKNKSYAVFGQFEWDILENLTFAFGARYINDEFEFDTVGYLANRTSSLEGTFLAFTVPPRSNDNDFDETIIRASLDWSITDDHLLYLSYAEGFRSGGFMIRAAYSERNPSQPNYTGVGGPAFDDYNPEDVWVVEFGLKSTWLDGALIANPVIYWQVIEGYQSDFVIQTVGAARGTNTYVNNIPEVEGWGIELDSSLDIGQLVSALEGLSMRFSASYQDHEITDGELPATRVATATGGPGSSGTLDLRDTPYELIRTPEWNTAATLLYESEINGTPFGGQISYRYQDDIVLTHLGFLPDPEDAYGVLDASVYVQLTEHVRLGLFGRNLTDERYRISSSPSLGLQTYARPRTYFGQLTVEF